MKTENYTKKDGKPGIRYALEKGDVIKAIVSTPRGASLGKSKFPSYSILLSGRSGHSYAGSE